MEMKQNPTLDFQRWNNFDATLSQRCFTVASIVVTALSKPVGLVISTDL